LLTQHGFSALAYDPIRYKEPVVGFLRRHPAAQVVSEESNMHKLQYVAAALVAVTMAAGAMANGSTNSNSDVAQLTALGCEMGRAYARQDLATLDKLNAEDYMQTDTRGVVVNRSGYLEYVRQRTADLIQNGVSTLSIDCDNIEVRLYGDAALVTGGWTYIVQKPDGRVARRSRWTSMWTRYPPGWKRHAFQNTWVNPDANQSVPTSPATR
jgi:ketosteroid isomerase-like protein